jgi:hypothetical protein
MSEPEQYLIPDQGYPYAAHHSLPAFAETYTFDSILTLALYNLQRRLSSYCQFVRLHLKMNGVSPYE